MDSSEPPEWVVVLDFRALPHGARHWIRVKIGPSPELLGTIETRSVPWWFCSPKPYCDDAWGPAREMLVHERTLDAPQCLEILNILASSTPVDLQSVREDRRVIDGCPCELMAVRREPRQQTRASFNLASIQRTALQNQPAVRLTRTLMALRDKISRE